MKLKLFTDGGSRNNPGPAGIGGILLDQDDKQLDCFKKYIGEATNNEAEYSALVEGLKIAKIRTDELDCFLDSELVVRQLNGIYKVKHEGMKRLYDEVQVLKMGFKHISFQHVLREKNKLADKLVNEAIDEALLQG